MIYKIPAVDFSIWLTMFTEAVNAGTYKKIPYHIWRSLAVDIKNINTFELEQCDNSLCIVIRAPVRSYTFFKNDDSFGEFLFRSVCMEQYMAYATNTMDGLTWANIDTDWPQTNINNTLSSQHHEPQTMIIEGDVVIKGDIIQPEKENKDMKFSNFDIGPVDDNVHMSMYGLAIKNASGTYVSYDVNSKQIMDVDIFNFEGANKLMYKMPVAIKDVAVGDVVIHARKPMFVVAVRKDGKLAVVDVFNGEEKVIMLSRSPFGFDFVTKVVSLVDFTSADASNPFGNMLPLLMLADKDTNDNDMLMFMALSGQSSLMSNPMMLYALLSKDKEKNILPILAMCNYLKTPIMPAVPVEETTE